MEYLQRGYIALTLSMYVSSPGMYPVSALHWGIFGHLCTGTLCALVPLSSCLVSLPLSLEVQIERVHGIATKG